MDSRERIERNTIVSFLSGVGIRLLDAAGGILFAHVAGASALGVYYTFVSLQQFATRINSVGLGDAIIKRISEYDHSDGDRTADVLPNLIGAALIIRAVPLSLIGLCIVVYRTRIDQYVGQELAWLLLLFVLVTFSLLSVIRATLIGKKQLHLSSYIDIVRSISILGVQLILVLLGWKALGLIVGLAFGLGITLLNAIWIADICRPSIPSRNNITSIVNFAKFSYVDNFLGGKHRWIDVIILGVFVEPKIVGIYGIVYSVSRFGLVLSTAIGQSVFPEVSSFANAANERDQRSLVQMSMLYSTLLSIPLLFGAATLGDLVLQYVYDFDSGHRVLTILAVGMIFYGVHTPVRKALYGLNAPEDATRVSLVAVLVNIGAGILLASKFGAIGIAFSTTVSMIVSLILGIHYLRTHLRGIFVFNRRPWLVQIGASLLMTTVVLGIRRLIKNQSLVLTLLLIILGVGVYFSITTIFDHRLRTRVRTKLIRFDSLPL